jgi:hypothetical protein
LLAVAPPRQAVCCVARDAERSHMWSQALTLCLESLLISVDDTEDGGV